jgi:hypothetical protein
MPPRRLEVSHQTEDVRLGNGSVAKVSDWIRLLNRSFNSIIPGAISHTVFHCSDQTTKGAIEIILGLLTAG